MSNIHNTVVMCVGMPTITCTIILHTSHFMLTYCMALNDKDPGHVGYIYMMSVLYYSGITYNVMGQC